VQLSKLYFSCGSRLSPRDPSSGALKVTSLTVKPTSLKVRVHIIPALLEKHLRTYRKKAECRHPTSARCSTRCSVVIRLRARFYDASEHRRPLGFCCHCSCRSRNYRSDLATVRGATCGTQHNAAAVTQSLLDGMRTDGCSISSALCGRTASGTQADR